MTKKRPVRVVASRKRTTPGKRLWEIWIDEDDLARLRSIVHHTKDQPGEAHSEGEFARRVLRAAMEEIERRLNGGQRWPPAPKPKAGRPSAGKMAARRAKKAAAKRPEAPPQESP